MKAMYEYNNETKTLTLNEWGDIRFLPYDIKRETEHLICRKRITSDIYLTRGLMELCMLKDMLICDENPEYKTVDGIRTHDRSFGTYVIHAARIS